MSTAVHEPTWTTYPDAYARINEGIDEFSAQSPMLRVLAQRMRNETGTNIVDWVDRLTLELSGAELEASEFYPDASCGPGVYRHRQAQLPAVATKYGKRMLAVKVESVIDFLQAQRLDSRCKVFGLAGAAIRKACIECHPDTELWVVERHGNWAWEASDPGRGFLECLAHHQERFRLRRREFDDPQEGIELARNLIRDSTSELGRDRTCDIFFAAERAYWQYRNTAGQLQRMRQDRLGLGWANHDHHTYRSSRSAFRSLIGVLELLGMECRERFYAGREAGWGAQVMEQPNCGIVVFADVDLAADEIIHDFAHQPLEPRDSRGTVGLWCELHGEAFLQAGMHHLECQFDFDAAREQLSSIGVSSMYPFTELPHLRQAFTTGERWPVVEASLRRALAAGWITPAQAQSFRTDGALGSHLEILQRRDGYKGFNPKGISDIISQTDPRKQS